jgi:4-amino-4-deoxy-L-arabinose transferase-like glycosyltransferase
MLISGDAPGKAQAQQAVLTTLAVSSAVWFLVPTFLHYAPPLDVVEGYSWGREWVLSTYKHPGLPSWLIEASRVITAGGIGWPVYLVSQALVAVTVWLAFLLGREMWGAPAGAAAAMVMVGLEPLAWMSPSLNHTLVQLPLIVAAMLLAWRAAHSSQPLDWIALGVVAGIGFYAKLNHILFLLAVAVWLLAEPQNRKRLASPWPWIAAAISVVIVIPLWMSLAANGWQVSEYARLRGEAPGSSPWHFVPRMLGMATLPLVLFAVVWLTRPRGSSSPGGMPSMPSTRSATRFLLVMLLVPLGLMMLYAIARGHGLRTMWGAPLMPALVLLGAGLLWPRFDAAALRRLSLVSIIAIAVMGVIYAATQLRREGADRVSRVNWPERKLSAFLAEQWRATTSRPLRIVAGDTWVGGLAVLRHPDRPSILTDGSYDRSPWIGGPAALARHGALVVWDARREIMPEVAALIGASPRLTHTIPTRRGTIEIGYAILPPK